MVLTAINDQVERWTCLLPECQLSHGPTFLEAYCHLRQEPHASIAAPLKKVSPLPKEIHAQASSMDTLLAALRNQAMAPSLAGSSSNPPPVESHAGEGMQGVQEAPPSGLSTHAGDAP